jgi:hypothetical protein
MYQKKVAGLYVSMNDISRMHKQEPSQNLIDKVLNVVVRQILSRVDNSMQVSLHELCDNVNISVASSGFGFQNINDSYDVIMLEKF